MKIISEIVWFGRVPAKGIWRHDIQVVECGDCRGKFNKKIINPKFKRHYCKACQRALREMEYACGG